ncbi:MAG: PspC domain-containing protein [Defluviitaleaceae bacterium]|nr:PspC domain-containing protein [Defluviitaleaceae bacterium]
MGKRLYKSRTDRKISGVCAGIAEYFGIDPTIVRLAWVIFMFMGGSGIIAYIVAAIVMPEQPAYGPVPGDDYRDTYYDNDNRQQ